MVSMITIRLCHHSCADCSVCRAAGGWARGGLSNLTINTNLTLLILQVQVKTLTHQHCLSIFIEIERLIPIR